MNNESQRFFLDHDFVGNWFMLPIDLRNQWDGHMTDQSDQTAIEFMQYKIDDPADISFVSPMVANACA